MAELTSFLQSPSGLAGGSPTPPGRGQAASGFLSGLGDLIAYRSNLADKREAKERQAKYDARADEEYTKAQKTDQVRDEVEGAVFNLQQQTIPPEVVKGADGLATTQAAVSQGKAPGTAFSLNLEKTVSELYTKYPDQRAEIATYLQGRGFDHYLFRGLKADIAQQDLEQTIQKENERAYAKAATDSGVFDPQDYQGSIERGRQVLFTMAKLKAAKEAADAARADRTLDIQEQDQKIKMADREGVRSVIELASVKIGPLFNQLNSLVSAAGDDPAKQRALTEAIPQLQASLKAFRVNATALAAGQGPDAMKELNAWLDQREKDVQDVISGDLSSYQLHQQNLKAMQTEWGIDAARALPLYTGLKSIFGTAGVTNYLGADPSMRVKPEVRDRLIKELDQYNPLAEPEEASVHLYNAARLLRGELNFAQLTPRQAREQLPGLIATASGVEKEIRSNGVTPEEAGRYRGAYSNLLSAAVQLEPGTTPVTSVRQATRLVTTPASRQTLEVLATNPDTKEMGLSLIQASRSTSAKLLEIARSSPVKSRGQSDGYMETEIVFDKAAGQYVAKPTAANAKAVKAMEERLRAQAAGAYSGLVQRPSTTIDPNIVAKVEALNDNTYHLAATAKFDDSVPKTMSIKELREAYATGVAPKAKNAEGKTPEQAFQESLNAFREGAQRATTGFIEDPNLKSMPRGLRNNNPGNIEDGDFARSLPGYKGSDGRFAIFETKEHGMEAMSKLLENYGKKGLDTVSAVINRWAPPSDDNPTDAYAAYVAKQLGVKPGDKINLADSSVTQRLAQAMHNFENGIR